MRPDPKIYLSQSTDASGRLSYTVIYQSQPIMASTGDKRAALTVLDSETKRQKLPFPSVYWNGDKGAFEYRAEFIEWFGVSPQDHSRGKGGFEGEFFTVKGVTNARFDSEALAVAAIQARFPSWREVFRTNSSGRTFKHPTKQKFLCTFESSDLVGGKANV